jgi:integrase
LDPATYKSYETITRLHINPAIGSLKVTDKALNPARILAFYDDLAARGVKLGSRRAIHSTLRAALSWAVLSNLLSRNPCFQLGRELRRSGEATAKKANPLTADDAARFLAYVDRHEEPWSPVFHFLHDSGVRVGEAAALKWAAVDLDRATASIESSYSAPAGGDKDTKTHKGRTIDLSTDLVDRLTTWRKAQRVESLKRGRTPRAYVFTNGRGQPQRPDGGMRRVFARVLKTLGIAGKGYTLHSLRDTFASTHLSQDWGKLGWVSTQLGHANTATTETHYFAFRSTASTKRYADDIRK